MQSFEHILTSFLWSISRIDTVVDLFFTIVLRFLYDHFRLRFSENRVREKEKNKLRHSRHFYGLYSNLT